MRGLKGKTAVVTGSGAGIGQAAAIRLAEEGCQLGIFDWNAAAAEGTAETIRAAGGQAIAVTVDVREEAQVEAAYAEVLKTFGKVDIVCSNAAIFSGARDLRLRLMQTKTALLCIAVVGFAGGGLVTSTAQSSTPLAAMVGALDDLPARFELQDGARRVAAEQSTTPTPHRAVREQVRRLLG